MTSFKSPWPWLGKGLVLGLVVLSCGLIATGIFYYQNQLRVFRVAAQGELVAIADLKVGQIKAWYQERKADARLILNNAMVQQRAVLLLGDQITPEQTEELRVWLSTLLHTFDYAQVAIYDDQGRPRLKLDNQANPLPPEQTEIIQKSLGAQDVIVTDLHIHQFHKDSQPGKLAMCIWIPLRYPTRSTRPAAGFLRLQIDPDRYFFPLIRSWPTPSRTGETLLVRREGDQVVFLNRLRHRDDPPLSFRLPLEKVDSLPAALGLLGQEGVLEGNDYRQVPVLAVTRKVPDTPWLMVAKVDQDELYAPLRARAWAAALIVSCLLLAAALGAFLLWRQRENLWLQQKLASDRQHQELADRILFLNEYANDIIFLMDQNWRITEANQRALQAYGYTLEEMQGMRALDFRPPQTQIDFNQQVDRLDLDGGAVYETLHTRKDGSVFPVEISLRQVVRGEHTYRQAIIRDITERKKAEDELRESEDRYRELIENISTGVAVYEAVDGGRDFVFRGFNQAGERIEKISRDQLLGRRVSEVFPGVVEFGLLDVLRRVYETGEPEEFPTKFYQDQRLAGWRENYVYKLKSGEVVAVYDDLTAEKEAEEARRAMEEKFRLAMESTKDGIWDWDIKSGQVYYSPSWSLILGEKEVEPSYQSWFSRIHPEELAEVRQSLQNHLEGQSSLWRKEHRLRGADGEWKWVMGRGQVVAWDDQGQPLRMVGTMIDISAQKRAEEEKNQLAAQLRQAQKMEAIGTLAGGIAHDFNNILAAIVGYSELARDDAINGKVDPQDLSQVIAAAERGRILVQQILTFGRSMDTELKPLSLNHVIKQTLRMLERTISKEIAMETVLEESLRPIKADHTQMEQVLVNLASNAQDAMGEGGRLIIETSNVTLDQEYCRHNIDLAPGDYVLLMVSDTGLGMSVSEREHIFEPFFTTKEVGKGTGLGLSMVYGIVKAHGGQIHCYSEPGMGTTFKIYLPTAEDLIGGEPMVPNGDTQEFRGHETIMVVDDEPALRNMALRTLSNHGYRVIMAESGEKALELYQKQGPEVDLVVLDLGMPGMGGVKCLRELLRINKEQKVMIASGYSANGPVKDALASGARGYVAKPFKRAELLATIREVLDQDQS